MKFFIGLSLPDSITSHLITLRGSLPFINWYAPDTYHIKLCDIGKITNYNVINDLDLSLEKIKFSSFKLVIQGVNHYTSPTNESLFWASITISDPLIQLKKKIEHILRQYNITVNKQRFVPHITLAKGIGLSEEQISNWLYKYNLFKTEPFEVYQFSLFNAHIGKDETHYIIEENYQLR